MGKALKGHKIVLVGSFSAYQYQVEDLIVEHGGEVFSFVDKSTTLVIRGEGGSLAKIQAAYMNQVPVHGEAYLEDLIRESIHIGVERAEAKAEAIATNPDYGTW